MAAAAVGGDGRVIAATKNLGKWYGRVLALDDVSLEVGPGITGLLGANGAGKTTLLRILVGLMRESAGEVRVLGEAPWNNPALAARVGYCPEHDGFWEWMTGREFTTSLARLRGLARPRDAAAEAIERVGLRDAADRKVFGYSRGMRQRLKLAQAVVHRPDFLVLDEPLTGCDPVVRQEILELIRGFAASGAGVLVSTHVLPEVEALTRRVAVMHRGRLAAEGDVKEIRALLDRHPRRIRIRCARPRDLAAALVREPGVTELAVEDGQLTVFTREPDLFHARLPSLALEAAGEVAEISSPDDTLEAVFRYLTEAG
jgi:ABC-2 type transport system ATP-binding protein